MRVIVFGSRGMRNPKPIYTRLARLEVHPEPVHPVLGVRTEQITVVHGDAPRGADVIADVCARLLDYEVDPHPADWRPDGQFNPAAGKERNQEMCDGGADLACGYWDGKSPGTRDMIKRVLLAGFELEVYRWDGVEFAEYRELV